MNIPTAGLIRRIAITALIACALGDAWADEQNPTTTQTPLEQDLAIIRTLLDTNGKKNMPIDSTFVTISGGRVVGVNFSGDRQLDKIVLPIIGNLTQLTSLYLVGSYKELPKEIGNLKNLTFLHLSGFFKTVAPEIGNLRSLSYLSLYARLCKEFPPELGNLTGVTQLTLGSDSLIVFPSFVGKMVNLTWLKIYGRNITTLPPEIGNCRKMEMLEAENLSLTTLPPEIGKLTKLEGLFLSNNKLTSLPSEIGDLVKVKAIYLTSNRLEMLPSTIGKLTILTGLHINENKLNTLPNEIVNLTQPKIDLMVQFNNLDSTKLSPAIVAWLDKYQPGWNKYQTVPILLTALPQHQALSFSVTPSAVFYTLPRSSVVSLSVFDMQGSMVALLQQGYMPQGSHAVRWQGNEQGAGSYIIRLTTGNSSAVQRVHVVR